MMQVGVALFEKDESKCKQDRMAYRAYPFNFYVFPRVIEGFQHPMVSIEPDTMEFHAKHKFDFQRWLEKGVSLQLESKKCR